MSPRLYGRNVLVVEYDYFLAKDLVRGLREIGAEVIGPAPTVDAALALINSLRREPAVPEGTVPGIA